MKQRKKNVILTHVPNDDQWPYCQLMSKETGREFHVEYMSTGNGSNHFRCLFCYVVFPLIVFFRRHRYDYIVAQQQFYGLLLAFYCNLFHVKKDFRLFILTFIYLPKKGLIGKIYYWFMRGIVRSHYIDAFSVHSTKEVHEYASIFGVGEERFHYVPLGLNDIEPQPEIPSMQERKYILSAGRSNRDYDFLCNALRDTVFQCDIICDTYHNSDVSDNIHIHNDIYKDMPLWLKNCYCVVIPLRDTNASSGQLVLLQAFQMGKPVIVTNASAINDYVKDRQNALSINNTKEELLSALKELYTNYNFYQHLMDNGKEDYRKKFSAEGNVICTAEMIKNL